MQIRDKKVFKLFIKEILLKITSKKEELLALNREITLDADFYINEDLESVKQFLNSFGNKYPEKMLSKMKPKGKVFIILSYNEPFIMSVIPIVNALTAGNQVIVKTSGKKTKKFMDIIWSDVISKYGLPLKIIIIKDNDRIPDFIKKVQAVYFFGSHKVAQVIAKICGENYVEFYPFVEAADVKIFDSDLNKIKMDARRTIEESFTHSGQTCQRIQGIFVQKKFFDTYLFCLKKEFNEFCKKNKFFRDRYIKSREKLSDILLSDIGQAKPKDIIIGRDGRMVVINPSMSTNFIKKAYFLPVLWIVPFGDIKQLVGYLKSRIFFLGLNIQSNNNDFIEYIVKNTGFSRYTINTSHTKIRSGEGWGGKWPSGYSGYKSWLEQFSDNYIILGSRNKIS